MRLILDDDRATLFHGDSAELGEHLPPGSVDALVTDPPAGIGFMRKGWDGDKGGRNAWIRWLAHTLTPSFIALKPGAHGLVWALPRTSHWTAVALEECGFEVRDRVSHIFLNGFPKSRDVSKDIDARAGAKREVVEEREVRPSDGTYAGNATYGLHRTSGKVTSDEPITDAAAEWDGWGTALKPAVEDWWLVQKPFASTIAENLLERGVGGLNIDACRIAADEPRPLLTHTGRTGNVYGAGLEGSKLIGDTTEGRWPTHLIVDDGVRVNDLATPARYFYAPKPARSEKDAGLDHLPSSTGGEATDRQDGSAGLKNPRAGAGRTGGARNTHPTVKSIGLMRWLCRLVSPPGGVVLDPFCGSGTTGVAALAEGLSFIGCEATEKYLPILEGRITYALRGTRHV